MKRILPSFASISLVMLVASLPAVCSAEEDPVVDEAPVEEEYVEAEPNPLFDLFYKVDDLLTAGDTEAATDMIIGALDDAQYAKYRTDLATVVQRFLLYTKQDTKARELFLETVRTEPETARPGFELIYSYYRNMDDPASALAWARELLEQPLPDDMKRQATGWLLNGLLDAGDEDGFFAELPRLNDYEPDQACAVASEMCKSAYNREKYDLLAREIAAFREAPYGKEPAMERTILLYDKLTKAAQGDWSGVESDFAQVLSTLDETDLRFLLRRVLSTARQQSHADVADRLAESVLRSEACKGYDNLRSIAAREWVSLGVESDPASLPDRAAALRALGLPANVVLSTISRHFYTILDNLPIVRRIIVEFDELRPLLEDDSRRNSLDSLMLDAAFVTEDYARALKVVEEGIPDRDETWHAMTRTKLGAHIALQKGDVDEAVRNFRAFMDIVAQSTETTTDPTSNVIHTPESILGFNAKRIGDIYSGAGRAEEAAKAYAEARDYYVKALARAKGESGIEGEEKGLGEETIEYIQKEMSAIP